MADTPKKTSPYLHSARWRIAYMALLLGFMTYLFRTNLNMTLPFMVKSMSSGVITGVNLSTSGHLNLTHGVGYSSEVQLNDEECREVSVAQIKASKEAEFSWDKNTQSFILSSYYYGFLVAQVPTGWAVGKLGGKRVITLSMLLSAVLTLLAPVLARTSVYAFIATRAAIGLFTGATVPSWYILMSRWALPHERSRFTGIIWFGQYLGTIIGYFSSGFLCANGFDNGWGSVFYIHGILGIVFVALWQYVVVEYPEKHPKISQLELKKLTSISVGIEKRSNDRTLKVPWLKILTHVPVLAMIVTHTLDYFVHYLVLICLPLYMKAVLKFDIQSNGVYSSLPFVSSVVSLFVCGMLADHVIKRQCVTVTNTRKLFQTTALFGTAVFLCLPGFMTCSQWPWVILCLCGGMFFQAAGYSAGMLALPVDMAPRFAPMIFAISNSFGTISGIVTPFVVAQLTPHDTVAEWRVVFFIAAGCAVVGALVFVLFSSSERVTWAEGTVLEIEVTANSKELHVIKPLVTDTDNDGLISVEIKNASR